MILMTSQEVADLLSVTAGTVKNWRSLGMGPPYVKLGPRIVRYKLEEVEAWASKQGFQKKSKGHVGAGRKKK